MIAIKMRHAKAPRLWCAITLSASEPGRYQITWMDERGPSGHTCRDDLATAVRFVIDDGYRLESAEPSEAEAVVHAEMQARADRLAEIESWIRECSTGGKVEEA